MKPIIILAVMLCLAGVSWGSALPNKFGGDEQERDYKCTCLLHRKTPVPQYKDMETRLCDMEKTLDKIYLMVADLHIKFTGQKRYNQIYDSDNEGEVAKQKRHNEQMIKELQNDPSI